jgi:tryptophan synthase alpha chain
MPICVGFGVKTAADAKAIAAYADGVVVGSSLINALYATLKDDKATPSTIPAVTALVKELASGVRGL